MAKTANCPYCGAEMEKIAGIWESAQRWKAAYSCPECKATSPVAESPISTKAEEEALTMALHRAEWYVYDDEYDECSNCNYLHAKKGPDGQDTACSYCPACGAKMELTGTKEEEQE